MQPARKTSPEARDAASRIQSDDKAGRPAVRQAGRIVEPDVRETWGCDNIFTERMEYLFGGN